MPAASPKALRCSEECTRWLDRCTYWVRDTFRQKLVVGISFTSILLDAGPRERLQDEQPIVTIPHILP